MEKIEIWNPGEYTYPMAFGFTPNLRAYLLEDREPRPCMMVLPGGGYAVVVPPEGELVAKEFNKLGYNCFVMTYTTNQLLREPLFDQPMRDLARAIRHVRKNADRYRVSTDQIYICGFSAAGHLCASLCDYFDEIPDETPEYAGISCRPDGAVLSYPVITSGKYAHQDSFRFLLGADIYDRGDAESEALLDRFSLEKHVQENTPPCFLWTTVTDGLVPMENCTLYEAALREKGVPHALHVFSHGDHGLSVANQDWADGKFGEPYAMEQNFALCDAIRSGAVDVPPNVREDMLNPQQGEWNPKPMPEISLWPVLADRFLKSAVLK